MNKTNLYKQRQNKNRVSILTSLAVLASPLVLPLHQAVAASLTTVANFNSANGANPKAALTPGASSGIFYGTASTGGANNKGVVYRLNVGTTSTITQLISFNTTNGATPESTLIPVGTASAGGGSGKGTVFKLTP